jgi:hypothetical protein
VRSWRFNQPGRIEERKLLAAAGGVARLGDVRFGERRATGVGAIVDID